MKTTISQRKSSQAFTLIEMIGVLAVIAILASMLIPKIFEAINSARINNTVQSYNAVKTAVLDHYGKYGAINYLGAPAAAPFGPLAAGSAPMLAYDRQVLLPEALIDKPFAARVGTTWIVQAVAGAGAVAVTGVNSAYDLDGSGAAANDADPSAFVVQALITGVAIADAIEISDRLDGAGTVAAPLSFPAGGADLAGRVKYAAPVNGLTDVYIYICHR